MEGGTLKLMYLNPMDISTFMVICYLVWLGVLASSSVYVQSRQFFLLLQTSEREKNIDMSQEGDIENEMPLGEEQGNSEL